MNVYKFALEFEKEHKEFYRKQAETVKNESLKHVFNELADEEEKHERIVKQISEGDKIDHIESEILPKVRDAFKDISIKSKANKSDQVVPVTQVDVYREAKEMETKSYNFYKEKAEETDIAFVKKAFKKLAREEKKHETILTNLIELVNRPNTWIDDAEMYHIEDY